MPVGESEVEFDGAEAKPHGLDCNGNMKIVEKAFREILDGSVQRSDCKQGFYSLKLFSGRVHF